MADSNLHKLSKRGQSVWIDSLSRTMLESGELARLMKEDAVVGVTTNPTIFQKAMSEGGAYDEQLKELLGQETDPKEIFLKLSARDVEMALDLFAPVHEADPQDGFVSWEVDPTLAYDRINVTLIFSLQRYKEVVEAYLLGLERLVASGGDPSKVHSVASFFVSRVDTETDKRLDAIGSNEALALRGKLAIANAKLAYAHFQEAFSGGRWEFLEGKGATVQRCLWASTSTKNPEYRDVMYVEELIGPNTVDTMPLETIRAFQDHGEVRGDTVTEKVGEARKLLDELAKVGVDYDDVTETLELEGVQKFADSFDELLDEVRVKRGELVTA